MRLRAGQRRLDWDRIVERIESGDIEGVEVNRNPNESVPYEEAYVMFITLDGQKLAVPIYFLEDGTMKAVTVIRE